jgi:hypothetical protein
LFDRITIIKSTNCLFVWFGDPVAFQAESRLAREKNLPSSGTIEYSAITIKKQFRAYSISSMAANAQQAIRSGECWRKGVQFERNQANFRRVAVVFSFFRLV